MEGRPAVGRPAVLNQLSHRVDLKRHPGMNCAVQLLLVLLLLPLLLMLLQKISVSFTTPTRLLHTPITNYRSPPNIYQHDTNTCNRLTQCNIITD